MRLKELELAVATKDGTQNTEEAARALAAFKEEQSRAAVSARTELGISTQAERGRQIVIDVNRKAAEGYVRTERERAEAIGIATKALREQIEQETIRRSLTPELTRFALESQNTLKAVDQAAAGALHGISDSLADVVMGTRTVKEAFADMAQSIVRDLLRIAVQKAILGPIAGGLSSLFGGGPSLIPSRR